VELSGASDRLVAVRGLAHDLEAVLLQQRRQRRSSQWVVVDEKDPL
jgi:hypothetical protein